MADNSGEELKGGRIFSIDIIRGVSILGIFLVNMMSFHSPLLYIDPLKWWSNPIDKFTYLVIDIFAQASFYPLFSMLFGFSLVLIMEKAKRRGMNFLILVFRRLFLLLLVGIVHAFFVWHGDILIQYAILGFMTLPFLALSGRKLLLLGVSLFGIPTILLTLLLIFVTLGAQNVDVQLFDRELVQQSMHLYQQGTFMEITKQRVIDWKQTNGIENFPFLFISIFPLFIIGAGIAKQKWLVNPEKYRKQMTNLGFIMLTLGLLFKTSPYIFNGNIITQYVQDSIGGLFLAIFYGVLIIIIGQKGILRKYLHSFAAIGKMSMSNYLFQSLISTLIFYHYGLGFYGKVTLFTGTLIVLGIFSMQVIFSQWWMKHFLYGPIEWLWRMGTNLKPVKLRKVDTN